MFHKCLWNLLKLFDLNTKKDFQSILPKQKTIHVFRMKKIFYKFEKLITIETVKREWSKSEYYLQIKSFREKVYKIIKINNVTNINNNKYFKNKLNM